MSRPAATTASLPQPLNPTAGRLGPVLGTVGVGSGQASPPGPGLPVMAGPCRGSKPGLSRLSSTHQKLVPAGEQGRKPQAVASKALSLDMEHIREASGSDLPASSPSHQDQVANTCQGHKRGNKQVELAQVCHSHTLGCWGKRITSSSLARTTQQTGMQLSTKVLVTQKRQRAGTPLPLLPWDTGPGPSSPRVASADSCSVRRQKGSHSGVAAS